MFAVLYLPDFALHAVLRNERDTTRRPAALFSEHRKKSLVVAVTAAARAVGVEPGQTAPQALARCPALLIRAPNPTSETEARATLLAIAFTLAPTIEDTAPGICTIDLRGIVLEKTLPLVRTALVTLNRHGLPCTAGIARTPLLALYAARATDSVCCVGTESESVFLAPLPLSFADPPPELSVVFAHWGLRTLGDLTALPRDEIIGRFGVAGLAVWQQATGGAHRPLRPIVQPQTFSAAREFEDPVEALEPLLFLLRRFLDRLTLELTASQFVAADITIELGLEDETAHTHRIRLPEPTADSEILFRALHTHLESLQTAAAVSALSIEITPARPLVRQQGLFETGLRDPHGFAETLARLSALVGVEHVGTPQHTDTHRPDAFRLAPPASTIPPVAEPPLHAPLSLPLRRFRPPLRVNLTEAPDGKLFLWSNDHRGEISFRSAPYYRNGDWWQSDRAWSRVEWDVALTEGGLYRLILEGEHYYLEGEYD